MDYKQAVKDKKTELSDLHKRMDADRELVELEKYILTDVNDKKIPNAISITLNDPAVFAGFVEAGLGRATEQVIVESDDKNLDTAYIEDFIKAALASANARLAGQGRWRLNPFFDQQMCRRGRGAAKCLLRMDEKTGQLITDIVPWDTRFVYYAMGADGLDWAAYETTRNKDLILAEHPEANVAGKTATVLDIYAKNYHEIWIEGKKFKEEKTIYDNIPVVIQMVPMGSMLADKDSFKYQGESIFFLIRDLIPELNRLVSIIQSLNSKALDNALIYKNPEGIAATPPKHGKITKPGSVTAIDSTASIEPVNYGEIKRSAYLLHSMIETRIQRGSLSNLDLGIMGPQPWSGTALIQLGEGRDQVLFPRLGTRGHLNEQLAEMIIDQTIKTGASSVEIGARGHKRSFNVGKLKGEYEVIFKYFIKSPEIDVARFSMAAAAGNLIPDKAKRRDILQREDPEGDETQLRWEEAERLSPAIKMNRTIQALMEMAKRGDKQAEFEAELMSAEMGINLKQMLAGEVAQQPKPEEAEKPKPMVPMFGGGGSQRRAAELQATPKAEEGEE